MTGSVTSMHALTPGSKTTLQTGNQCGQRSRPQDPKVKASRSKGQGFEIQRARPQDAKLQG